MYLQNSSQVLKISYLWCRTFFDGKWKSKEKNIFIYTFLSFNQQSKCMKRVLLVVVVGFLFSVT